ncbi:gag-pol polyprotein, partial [Trifolium medium]|nr:gag-pol polyprotein [Trifolium medium]
MRGSVSTVKAIPGLSANFDSPAHRQALAAVLSRVRKHHEFSTGTGDLAGRMVAWAVELTEYDITYVPRGSIKSQALADFILELTSPPGDPNTQPWTLSVDGASNLRGSGAGVVLEGPDGILIEQSLRFAFKASNNQEEYEVLLAGMRLAKEMDVSDLRAMSDSQLVTNQFSGEFQTKEPQLIKYVEQVRRLAEGFNTFELVYVPRDQNARADLLSKLASTKKPGNNRTVIQETIARPSTGETHTPSEEVMATHDEEDWRSPIIRYLLNDELPTDREEAVKVKKRSTRYTMVGRKLYKRGISAPMLLCAGQAEAKRILNEIHAGSCGSHIGA